MVECGFEQCLVDPCVFRLMVADDVVAMMVFHVDDIKIAATEVTDLVVSALNQRFPTKHLGEVEWYMGSEYKGDREKVFRRFYKLSSFGVSSIILTSRSPAPSPSLRPWT